MNQHLMSSTTKTINFWKDNFGDYQGGSFNAAQTVLNNHNAIVSTH